MHFQWHLVTLSDSIVSWSGGMLMLAVVKVSPFKVLVFATDVLILLF